MPEAQLTYTEAKKACFMNGLGEGRMTGSVLIGGLSLFARRSFLSFITNNLGSGTAEASYAISAISFLVNFPLAHKLPSAQGASCD